jgi:hypothetical protein
MKRFFVAGLVGIIKASPQFALSLGTPLIPGLGVQAPIIAGEGFVQPGSSGSISSQYFFGPNGKFKITNIIGPSGTISSKEYVNGAGINAATLVGPSGSISSANPSIM